MKAFVLICSTITTLVLLYLAGFEVLTWQWFVAGLPLWTLTGVFVKNYKG